MNHFWSGFEKQAQEHGRVVIPMNHLKPEAVRDLKNKETAKEIGRIAPASAGIGAATGALAGHILKRKHLGYVGGGIGALAGIAASRHNANAKVNRAKHLVLDYTIKNPHHADKPS